MVLDDQTVSELVDTHQLCINPSLLIVRMSYLNEVARIPHIFRNVKLCLIVAQYLCERRRYTPAGPLKFIASFIHNKIVDSLRELEQHVLMPYERFVADIKKH